MDETEDIVQVEFSGAGTFTVTLDPATFLPPAIPPRYNQEVMYVTGKPSVVIEGADSSTFFSIFTVGSINAVNQALFPEGQVYDAQADVTLVEVINSTGMGGMQLSNTVFSGTTGKVGIDARGVPIAVRLTVGDIDASGSAIPYLLFGEGSFTVAAGNPGLRITGGDLIQINGASIVVAESGSSIPGFDTLITQNNVKSDNTPQPTQSINTTFASEDNEIITVTIEEITIGSVTPPKEVLNINGTIESAATNINFIGTRFDLTSEGQGFEESLGEFSYSRFWEADRAADVEGCEFPNTVFRGLSGSSEYVFDVGVLLLNETESFECAFVNNTYQIDFEYEVVGGTGLFEGAKGTVSVTEDAVGPFPFPGTLNFVGTIELNGNINDDDDN